MGKCPVDVKNKAVENKFSSLLRMWFCVVTEAGLWQLRFCSAIKALIEIWMTNHRLFGKLFWILFYTCIKTVHVPVAVVIGREESIYIAYIITIP